MKRLTLTAFLFIILFSACKKEHNTEDNFHVNFTQDGVSKSFTGHVVAHRDTVGNYYSLTIIGANTATSFDNYMSIYIDNDPVHGSFTTGEYPDNSPSFSVLSTYTVNSIEHESGQSVALDAAANGITLAHHFKVIITSIDNNTIRGTFSGDYYKNGDTHSAVKFNITNGDFYAKFQ